MIIFLPHKSRDYGEMKERALREYSGISSLFAIFWEEIARKE